MPARSRPQLDDPSLMRVLKALAHPVRFAMVEHMAREPELSCGQLGEKFALAQPTISHHLKILHEAGLLVARHEGQHHFLTLNREQVDRVLALLPRRLVVRTPNTARRPRSSATAR